MPALGGVIQLEKEAAAHGGENLDRWRALRLNRGTPDVGDHDKIVKLEDWSSCVVGTADLPAKSGPVAIGFDMGGSASMSCFAVYWPETGRFMVFGAFRSDPSLELRGNKDEVGDRYVTMKERGEVQTLSRQGDECGPIPDGHGAPHQGARGHRPLADAYWKGEAEQEMAEGVIEWNVEWRRVGAGMYGSANIRAFQAEVLEEHLSTRRSLLMDTAIYECNIGHDTNGNPRLDKSRTRGTHRRTASRRPGGRIGAPVALAVSGPHNCS